MNAIRRTFDGDWLSNFETDSPNGNWIGIDVGKPVDVRFVRIVPRSDDNDICSGNDYELFYWTGEHWESLGFRTADDNVLHYNNVPSGSLLWLRNYTRGWDERPFMVDSDGNVEWR